MGKQTPAHISNPPAREIERLDRARYAAKLRREGHSWDEVAETAGYYDGATAHRAVRRVLAKSQELAYEEVNLYRQESLERLTKLLKAVWPRAISGDDKSVREARLIISQMDDLTGAKAPIQVEIGESDVDRLLREAEAELGRRVAAAQVEAARAKADPGADHPS